MTRVWSVLLLQGWLITVLPWFCTSSERLISIFFRYRPLGQSHQLPIESIETKSICSANMATPSGCPYMVTTIDNLQSPHIIPSDEDSIWSEAPLLITIDIQPLSPPQNYDPSNEPNDETLHKNSVETLSIHTLNLVHSDATNLLPVPPPPSSAPYKNRTHLELLNLHRILGCR